MPKDVNPAQTAISGLKKDEKEELKLLHYSYKHDLTIYKQKNAVLEALQSFIQELISQIYLTYMFDCETSYNMLIALKTHIVSMNQAQKMKLINHYQRLKKAPKAQHVGTWLQE
jgi:hypothetical protein